MKGQIMRKFENIAAQGEISIRRIDNLPNGLKAREPDGDRYIIGHSETGHHHSMVVGGVEVLDDPDFSSSEGFMRFYVKVSKPTPLVHERNFDTHEPLLFAPGTYEITINREYDPYAELARISAD